MTSIAAPQIAEGGQSPKRGQSPLLPVGRTDEDGASRANGAGLGSKRRQDAEAQLPWSERRAGCP